MRSFCVHSLSFSDRKIRGFSFVFLTVNSSFRSIIRQFSKLLCKTRLIGCFQLLLGFFRSTQDLTEFRGIRRSVHCRFFLTEFNQSDCEVETFNFLFEEKTQNVFRTNKQQILRNVSGNISFRIRTLLMQKRCRSPRQMNQRNRPRLNCSIYDLFKTSAYLKNFANN